MKNYPYYSTFKKYYLNSKFTSFPFSVSRFSSDDHSKRKQRYLKNEHIKPLLHKEYFPHLKDYQFPKPSRFIFPAINGEDKCWKACDYRINHKISIPLWLYFESLSTNKNDIYKRLKPYAGVYILINNINNKYYIGSSNNLTDRMTHYYHSFSKGNTDRAIHKAVFKHGIENFSLGIILLYLTTQKDQVLNLLNYEQKYIDIYKPKYNQKKAIIKK